MCTASTRKMASLAQQLGGALQCPPFSTTRLSKHCNHLSNSKQTQKPNFVVRAVASPASVGVSNAETRERQRLKQLFQDAYERCRKSPLQGVSFTLDDFVSKIENFDVFPETGGKVSSSSLVLSLLLHIMCRYCVQIVLCKKIV